MRRGRTYYFMKRLPRKISGGVSNRFLRLSLRTEFPLDAVVRAGSLLAVYEQKEPEIVDALKQNEISPSEAEALLKAILRKDLNRILQEQNSETALSDQEIDERIAALKAENQALRDAMKFKDWSLVQPALCAAGEKTSLPLPLPVSPDLGRRAASLQRQINKAEIKTLNGEDVRVAAAKLLSKEDNADFDQFIKGEIMLSGAIESAVDNATSRDMARKIAATGEIALEFFGDIPLSTITADKVKDLMFFIQRIPSLHGKKHGNNRFVHDREKATKREEVEHADLHDASVRAEIEADETLSLPEMRARLAERLLPRLTMTTVGHHLDRLHGIFRNAQKNLDYTGQTRFLTHSDMKEHIKGNSNEKSDPLFVRKDRPKDREAWSQERLKTLLMSPIYTGCASIGRRWQPGSMIVRDAKYWVPLLVMTLGSRILEILQLKKTDLILHNGVLCLTIGITSEHRVKNSDSMRTLPLPQLLIDLGFVEWVHSLPVDQRLLFPSPAGGADIAAIAGNFGKQLKTLYRRLGIADWSEDFYALRKTLSSALDDAGVPENRRQAIAGHAGGTTLNKFYTKRNVSTLKSELEKFDLKVTVAFSDAHDHPVIEDCNLIAKPVARVEVELGKDETASLVRVKSMQTGEILVNAKIAQNEPHSNPAGKGRFWTPQDVAVQLRSIGAAYELSMPQTLQRRQAVESLMTYGYKT
ncbi:Phage integrase family protein [Phaeobacter italicus]|uniref:Phage integrase family protein n=1 Tax=Phaeobacter italicus TaxID=481446 RepID=A0A0H5DH03_9RHOB|nr:tyrosine-type recombinase/integrase [Phaeobacter italicus]CRL10715.1 Phage integrase family protein [Phaeobacter italicus]